MELFKLCYIICGAELLTNEEEQKLMERMKPLTEYGNIAFISSNNGVYHSTSVLADSVYHQMFGTQSGTIFLIDMYNREIYVFSDGSNYNIITKSKAYLITDNVYRYATNEEYYKCADEAFKQINTLLDGKKILEPMRYITNVLIAITVAFFSTFIFMYNKTKLKKHQIKKY